MVTWVNVNLGQYIHGIKHSFVEKQNAFCRRFFEPTVVFT